MSSLKWALGESIRQREKLHKNLPETLQLFKYQDGFFTHIKAEFSCVRTLDQRREELIKGNFDLLTFDSSMEMECSEFAIASNNILCCFLSRVM